MTLFCGTLRRYLENCLFCINTIEVNGVQCCLVTNILHNIFFLLQKKKNDTDLDINDEMNWSIGPGLGFPLVFDSL